MEAETKMRAKGKGGMTDAEVVDFVDRYMPAYKARAYKAPGLLLATEQLTLGTIRCGLSADGHMFRCHGRSLPDCASDSAVSRSSLMTPYHRRLCTPLSVDS